MLLEHDVIANEIIGGLPESIDDCDCFDICTAPSIMTPFGEYAVLINEGTFRRIIQFAVRCDGNTYQSLADRILSSIDEYFDLVFSTTFGTESQWNQLRDEAIKWAERFFEKTQDTLPTIINTIQENILNLFDKQKESIATRAGSLTRNDDQISMKLPPSSYSVRDFVKVAVYEEVLKVAASESMKASLANIDQISNDSLLNNKKRNELLSMAKRHIQFWEISAEDLNRRRFFAIILEHLVRVPIKINRLVTSLRTRLYLDWYQEHPSQYEFLDALDTFANLTNQSRRQEYAREYLVKVRQSIVEQKPLFERNLSEWIERKRIQFYARINTGHQYAIAHMKERRKAHLLAEIYSDKFGKCECQLIAAKNLAKFNGIKPTIFENQLIGSGGFFNVYAATWADKQNLAVKRQNASSKGEYPYAAYMEAHYHRAITNTRQANVVPLLYLYYDNEELYIFMPRYKQSLQDYLQKNITEIKFDKVLSFALIIASILNDIHQNDLVHRDIKPSNILLDDDDQCYLSDFGTVGEGTTKKTIVGTLPLPPEILRAAMFQQQSLATVYDGKANDIFSYGVFLYELLPKREYSRPRAEAVYNAESLFQGGKILPLPSGMDDYEQLVLDCLEHTPEDRPTASTIIKRLEELIRRCEVKRCTVCLERERTVRTLPCGHKVLCQQCRNDLRSRNYDLCVVCKRLMNQDVYDDSHQTFCLKR
jgi:serine/threonine-protein kinase